ncbi:MAG: RDD family protein [Acidobacteriota bacterium]
MKCQGCGHDYPGTLTRCPRCKLKNPERAQSTVLLFPTPPSAQEEKRDALPGWRVELNEKLKEIRARRSATHNVESVRAVEPYGEEPAPRPRTVASSAAATGARLAPVTSTQSASARSSNPVVEAALNRARTASENASRAVGQESHAARPLNSASVVMGRDATAKALAPEVAPHREETPGRMAEERSDFKTRSAPATATRRVIPSYEADDLPDIGEDASAYSVSPAIEMEPRDYLTEEIEKLRTQSMQQAAERLPSVAAHFVIGAIDLLVVAVSCAPFFALIRVVSGSLTESNAILAAVSMGLVISLFYFSLTQSLTGKTFGMMFTGTRLVDAYTQEHPTIGQNVLRTFGYLIAVAPAMIGLLWIAISSDRRGWQDYISGTMVIRD